MRSDEFFATLSALFKEDGDVFEKMKRKIPLGLDSTGKVAYAREEETPFSTRHTCVTGGGKSAFIRRLLLTVANLYERSEVCFFVISPYTEYGELVYLKAMDITLPYIRGKEDVEAAVKTLRELLRLREYGRGYPRLFVVLDGLETLEGCNRNQDLEEYRELLDLLARRENIDVVTGVDLTKSIFSGFPGAFVGVGNALVATRESGSADLTHVRDDGSLTLPSPIHYPNEPSLTETVLFFNALSKDGN